MYLISNHANKSPDVWLQFQYTTGSAEVQLHSSQHQSSKRTFLLSAGDTDRFCHFDIQNISASLISSSPSGVSLKNKQTSAAEDFRTLVLLARYKYTYRNRKSN